MDLKTFLLARIEEDEAVAQEAIDDDGGSDKGFSGQYERMVQPPSGIGFAQGGFGGPAARMIATFAVPARVLAECAAKRAIVEMHSSMTYDIPTQQDDGSVEYWHNHTDLVEVRRNGNMVEQITSAEWLKRAGAVLQPPARELRAIAAVYADHPDYQPEWKV